MGYSMPQIPYMEGFGQLGRSIASTGQAFGEAVDQQQKLKALYKMLEDLEGSKSRFKAEVARTVGGSWTPNQLETFFSTVDRVDNPDAIIELGKQFADSWQYYQVNKDFVRTPPMPFQGSDAYQKAVDPQIKMAQKTARQKGISDLTLQTSPSSAMPSSQIQESEPGIRELEGVGGGLPGGLPEGYTPEQRPTQPQRPAYSQEDLMARAGAAGYTMDELAESPAWKGAMDQIPKTRSRDEINSERQKELDVLVQRATSIDRLAGGETLKSNLIMAQESEKERLGKLKEVQKNILSSKKGPSGIADQETMQMAQQLGIKANELTPEGIGNLVEDADANIRRHDAVISAFEKRLKELRAIETDQESKEWEKIFMQRKAGESGSRAAVQAVEFSEKEKIMIGATEEGKLLLGNLVNRFNEAGFGGAGNIPGQVAGSVPGVGKYIAPKFAGYKNLKYTMSETWLRAATGAAANAKEIELYNSFLPNESDPVEIANNKVLDFFDKISAKAAGTIKSIRVEAEAYRMRGMNDFADAKDSQANLIARQIIDAKNSIPKIGSQDNSVEKSVATREMVNLAMQAFKDPEATSEERKRAQEILESAGVTVSETQARPPRTQTGSAGNNQPMVSPDLTVNSSTNDF